MYSSFDKINPILNFYPKLIIWELYNQTNSENINNFLSTRECFSVMENIAEFSKPIIVLAGNDPLDRSDIVDIILYGNSLGLKMIVETDGKKLNQDLQNVLRTIGTKSIRIYLNDRIKESIEDGLEKTKKFSEIENIISSLKKDGFEIQIGIPVKDFDVRAAAFNIDYALRKKAKGIYFNLKDFSIKTKGKKKKEHSGMDRSKIIEWIADHKKLLPNEMYFSPQCVRYGLKHIEDHGNYSKPDQPPLFTHWCLGGKTFAYINIEGMVQICGGIEIECGNLREMKYNFHEIWNNSEVFSWLRNRSFSCPETNDFVSKYFEDANVKMPKLHKNLSEQFEHQS